MANPLELAHTVKEQVNQVWSCIVDIHSTTLWFDTDVPSNAPRSVRPSEMVVRKPAVAYNAAQQGAPPSPLSLHYEKLLAEIRQRLLQLQDRSKGHDDVSCMVVFLEQLRGRELSDEENRARVTNLLENIKATIPPPQSPAPPPTSAAGSDAVVRTLNHLAEQQQALAVLTSTVAEFTKTSEEVGSAGGGSATGPQCSTEDYARCERGWQDEVQRLTRGIAEKEKAVKAAMEERKTKLDEVMEGLIHLRAIDDLLLHEMKTTQVLRAERDSFLERSERFFDAMQVSMRDTYMTNLSNLCEMLSHQLNVSLERGKKAVKEQLDKALKATTNPAEQQRIKDAGKELSIPSEPRFF